MRKLHAELAVAARGLAAYLMRRGVARGDLVGLRVSRTMEIPVPILGTMLASAAYVPLDPKLHRSGSARSPGNGDHLHSGRVPACASGKRRCPVSQDNVAYMIYTSGSTRQLKGCVITHRNVLSLLGGARSRFDVGSGDRWTLFHSISFDVSVWELWVALATGGTAAVVVDGDAAHDPVLFLRLLIERWVTMLLMVPAVLRLALDAYLDAGRPRHALRYVIFAGEAADLDAAATFAGERQDGLRLVNMYGPTETTVYATHKELDDAALRGANPWPIGHALPHLEISLRDDAGVEVTGSDAGEMWIAGGGVGLGYLGRDDLTAERFVTAGGIRYYRTRDCPQGPDSSLEFLGRIDRQIKLRGFRIELAEIESVVRKCTGVSDLILGEARALNLPWVGKPQRRREQPISALPAPDSASTTPRPPNVNAPRRPNPHDLATTQASGM